MKHAVFRDDPDGTLCLKYRKLYLAKYGENCALTNLVLTRIIEKAKRRGRILAQMRKVNDAWWPFPVPVPVPLRDYLRR